MHVFLKTASKTSQSSTRKPGWSKPLLGVSEGIDICSQNLPPDRTSVVSEKVVGLHVFVFSRLKYSETEKERKSPAVRRGGGICPGDKMPGHGDCTPC